jgi:hypothetical protein
MPQTNYEEARLQELRAILDNIRYECQDLIDDEFLAFMQSGRAWQEWNVASEYERAFFRAMNNEKLTFEERRGALKVIRAYLKDRIETFELEGMYAREGKNA